jgi:hypothetical protein
MAAAALALPLIAKRSAARDASSLAFAKRWEKKISGEKKKVNGANSRASDVGFMRGLAG